MAASINVLHLSDIQFGRNHRFGRLAEQDDAGIVLDTLWDRLSPEFTLLDQEKISPDVVIVSGDLAETGSKQEFDDAAEFLGRVADRLKLSRENIAIIPGNHDINRKHCEGYFATCEGDGLLPEKPYWPKWKNYNSFFKQFYGNTSTISFTEEVPWTFQEIPALKLVIAGMNSTLEESHLPDSHFGIVGEKQLKWFADKLQPYTKSQWFRLGIVHHNLLRSPTNDDENLRDYFDFKRSLEPFLNIVLHGHVHEGGLSWLSSNIPIVATGSAALKQSQRPEEIGNQYQVIKICGDRIERWLRRYDPHGKQWIGDTRESQNGTEWKLRHPVLFLDVSAALSIAATPIVQINKSVSTEDALKKLASLPRIRLRKEPYHAAVRQEDQERLAQILRAKQLAWLVADWAQGKDGFLGCALERLQEGALDNVFRLNCGNVSDCNDLIHSAETQLGLSFQEFLAAISALPFSVLLLDDLPQIITSGREREPLDVKLKSILDFCSNLRIIIIGRQVPRITSPDDIVALRPLEATEVKDYLKCHPRLDPTLLQLDAVERIYLWSGGLPMHLDRLLERLAFVPLSQILGEETNAHHLQLSEPVPESLVRSVQTLTSSTDLHTQKSLHLLKVLTVLRDGETFETIRRFFPRQPFYQSNIDELISHALIEPVPIAQSAPNLGFKRATDRSDYESPRLLRVPRQVRDYVSSVLSDKDKEDIIWASMSFFFGQQWWKKVRLRTTIDRAYSQSALAGPGNEHVIARLVLRRAIDRRDYPKVERYARVFVSYCAKLIERDRFRDAAIATEGMVDLLADLPSKNAYIDVAYIYGKALHMTGQNAKAITVLEQVIEVNAGAIVEEFRSDILLVMALSYVSLRRETDALNTAKQVIELSLPESHNFFQAQAIVAGQTLGGVELTTRLRDLESSARSKGSKVAADNIALDLAKETTNPDEAVELLQRVLRPDGDTYNRTRAIIEKAAILAKNKRLSELADTDHQILSEAYSYCYAQRFGNLLDRCHRVLWAMCKRDRMMHALYRLFRFSSFIWRLRGEETREHEYVTELDSLASVEGDAPDDGLLKTEFTYFNKRRLVFIRPV